MHLQRCNNATLYHQDWVIFMTDWDDFRLFLALYRNGSLRGAAQQLGVNHSTVSRRVSRLNSGYGAPLFDKTPLGYQVTEAGQSLLRAALEMEATFQNATRQIKTRDTLISGQIKISLPEAIARYLIFDELLDFQTRYPNIQFIINASYAFANLDNMEADVVIRGCNTPPEHLVGKRIGNMNLGIYARKDAFNSSKKSNLKWAIANMAQTKQDWFIHSGAADLPVGWVIEDFQLRYQAVTSGKAIARAPCYIGDQNTELMRLPDSGLTPLYDLWVLTHKDSLETQRVRLLMDYLYEVLVPTRKLLAGD